MKTSKSVVSTIVSGIKKLVTSNRVAVEQWSTALVTEAGNNGDKAHTLLLACREALCADLEAAGVKTHEPAHKAQMGQVSYIGKVVAFKLGYPVGSTWNKQGFKMAAPEASGKEKGVTGEQDAAKESMQGAVPKAQPKTQLAALCAQIAELVASGKVDATDAELALTLALQGVTKTKKAA